MFTEEKINRAIIDIVNERLLAAIIDVQGGCDDSEKNEILEWAQAYSHVRGFFREDPPPGARTIKARTMDPRF